MTRLEFTIDFDRPSINELLPPHPDPFHIYTRAELDAYEAAARHIWAVHHLICTVPICVERRPRQLERHAYPGQPAHRAEHVIQPCTCTYHLFYLLPTGHIEGVEIVCNPVLGSSFRIHPMCPHHGHLAHADVIERLWSDPYLNGILRDPYDMDDDERRSH